LGFVYKKTKAIPGKADPEKQEEFVAIYWRQLKLPKVPRRENIYTPGIITPRPFRP